MAAVNTMEAVVLPLSISPYAAMASATVTNQYCGASARTDDIIVCSNRNDAQTRWIAFCK